MSEWWKKPLVLVPGFGNVDRGSVDPVDLTSPIGEPMLAMARRSFRRHPARPVRCRIEIDGQWDEALSKQWTDKIMETLND